MRLPHDLYTCFAMLCCYSNVVEDCVLIGSFYFQNKIDYIRLLQTNGMFFHVDNRNHIFLKHESVSGTRSVPMCVYMQDFARCVPIELVLCFNLPQPVVLVQYLSVVPQPTSACCVGAVSVHMLL